ncbi:MAG: UDP-N-acetylmuramoyl-L-alanyl-D-glutamate--2,6-diaminopimelate ligase [Ignavibacteriae bacterium]|nr:MAG: UDP-N-acetylmuramoyl-L-alanyl-D-glutamate--2,6-diaminopimelate ligase [Ignavibacteriota bacterium]
MKLSELLNSISTIQVTGSIPDADLSGIEYDSRKVEKNSIFVAIKGFKVDGHNFIQDALNSGASAIILDDEAVPEGLFKAYDAIKILVKDSRIAMAEASDYFYGEPSKKMNVIGITGTNGKTTTSYFVKSIFEQAGFKTGLIGTINNYIGDEKVNSKLTTPESNELNKLLSEMHSAGCKYVVMEVSSHSLALNRVYNIDFSFAVFTNLTAEHLDFHQNFEKYLEAKKLLFDSLPKGSLALYNADEIHNVDVLKDCAAIKYRYGSTADADFRIENISYNLDGTSFIISHKGSSYNMGTTLVGDFNAYNACAAFAISILSGIKPVDAQSGIKITPQVPGRFEVFNNGSRKIIIDYSHTPDGLEKALLAIQNLKTDDQTVYTVFGCGGNRDKQKRPLMGKIATELSDKVIITSDNPRDEDPFSIIEEIKSSIEKNNYKVIENREEAIKEAIVNSKKNSVVLIAGKGHEDYQEIKGVRSHFSDREVAEKYLHN